jgi:hypothetical protein
MFPRPQPPQGRVIPVRGTSLKIPLWTSDQAGSVAIGAALTFICFGGRRWPGVAGFWAGGLGAGGFPERREPAVVPTGVQAATNASASAVGVTIAKPNDAP